MLSRDVQFCSLLAPSLHGSSCMKPAPTLLIRPSPPSLEMVRIKVSIVSDQWTSACYQENNFICKITDAFVKFLFREEEKSQLAHDGMPPWCQHVREWIKDCLIHFFFCLLGNRTECF